MEICDHFGNYPGFSRIESCTQVAKGTGEGGTA
jgi:hypothetical protein